jgi:hypothetical protein
MLGPRAFARGDRFAVALSDEALYANALSPSAQ